MKTKFLLLTVVLALAAGLSVALAQTKRNRAAKEFMRDKLELSQRVLEGLATEDYDLIIAKGTRLSAMSKEADWRVFENPDYDQQSVLFRRQVDSLVKAARSKNLDAATLAYVDCAPPPQRNFDLCVQWPDAKAKQGCVKSVNSYDRPLLGHAHQYTCPMHPEVVKDAAGNCPKCGMKLVEKK